MTRHSKATVIIPPLSATIDLVRFGLASKGLPRKLIENILQFAGFVRTEKSQPRVPHHPLHPDNKNQLIGYLDGCRQLVIRTVVVCHHVANPMYRFIQPDRESETTNTLRSLCGELVTHKWPRENQRRWTSHLDGHPRSLLTKCLAGIYREGLCKATKNNSKTTRIQRASRDCRLHCFRRPTSFSQL